MGARVVPVEAVECGEGAECGDLGARARLRWARSLRSAATRAASAAAGARPRSWASEERRRPSARRPAIGSSVSEVVVMVAPERVGNDVAVFDMRGQRELDGDRQRAGAAALLAEVSERTDVVGAAVRMKSRPRGPSAEYSSRPLMGFPRSRSRLQAHRETNQFDHWPPPGFADVRSRHRSPGEEPFVVKEVDEDAFSEE